MQVPNLRRANTATIQYPKLQHCMLSISAGPSINLNALNNTVALSQTEYVIWVVTTHFRELTVMEGEFEVMEVVESLGV